MTNDYSFAARESKAWPFEQARKIVSRYPNGKRDAGGNLVPVIFETGYGPSGLPHIGTFQEVLRTTLVRRAYETLTDGHPTKLIVFSDDMDGLRRVPDNIPNHEMLNSHLDYPLSRIPDPFDKFESFAHHNNSMLRDFLDRFGFDYEFVSSSDRYNFGNFNDAIRNVLRHYDSIMEIMLPTLGPDRQRTYSPILPVSPTTGVLLQVPIEIVDAENGIIRFVDDDGRTVETCVFDGNSKLQWKIDWAMRWRELDVDFEMCGKDLTDSFRLSSRIVRILGGNRPEGMIYELFLDENGEKISKSKGNGLTIDQWLEYGDEWSLGLFLYRDPTSAKQLHAGIIPKIVDEYYQFRAKLLTQSVEHQLGNPAWHLTRVGGHDKSDEILESLPITYGLLINLVGVLGPNTINEQVWSYLVNYIEAEISSVQRSTIEKLISSAIAYNRDFVFANRNTRLPVGNEIDALYILASNLEALPEETSADYIQSLVYDVGKDPQHGFTTLGEWFKTLYETLLGTSSGPRMGSFIKLYGIANSARLIHEVLEMA